MHVHIENSELNWIQSMRLSISKHRKEETHSHLMGRINLNLGIQRPLKFSSQVLNQEDIHPFGRVPPLFVEGSHFDIVVEGVQGNDHTADHRAKDQVRFMKKM